MLKDDFLPQIWVPSWENRDLRQLLCGTGIGWFTLHSLTLAGNHPGHKSVHHPPLQTGEGIPKDSRLRHFIQAHSRSGNRRQVENPWRDNLWSARGFCGRGGSQQQAVD
jgi:hypothetical protein